MICAYSFPKASQTALSAICDLLATTRLIPKIPFPKQVLVNTHTAQRAHYYENVRVKIKLQLEYIPCKYQENILRHKNTK